MGWHFPGLQGELMKRKKHSGYEIGIGEQVVRQSVDLESYVNEEVKRERARMRRKVIYAVSMLMVVYIVAIVVFHTVEGWKWEDSIYFTTSTITTVGYGDLTPQTYWGRLFTIPLMWIGIAVGLYVIYTVQEYGRAKLDAVGKHVDNVAKHVENLRNNKDR